MWVSEKICKKNGRVEKSDHMHVSNETNANLSLPPTIVNIPDKPPNASNPPSMSDSVDVNDISEMEICMEY